MLRQSCTSASKFAGLYPNARWLSSIASSSRQPNEDLVQMLNKIIAQEKTHSPPDLRAIRAVERAVQKVSRLPTTIATAEDIDKIKGLNRDMRVRMTGLVEGQDSKSFISTQALRELMSLPGIGRGRALQLYQAGCRSIDDLRGPFYKEMTEMQKAYLDFREHIEQDTDRSMASAIYDCVRGGLHDDYDVVPVGGYRRGLDSFSVTELLIFHPTHVHVPTPDMINTTAQFSMLEGRRRQRKCPSYETDAVTDILRQRGVLATRLRGYSHRWQGILRIPERDQDGRWELQPNRLRGVEARQGVFRRVDISVAPLKSRGAATLILTGDSAFLTYVRGRAAQLGLLLNEFGLWRFHPKNDEGLEPSSSANKDVQHIGGHWELLPSDTEEDIFDQLSLDWVEPQKRNFVFIETSRRVRYQRKF